MLFLFHSFTCMILYLLNTEELKILISGSPLIHINAKKFIKNVVFFRFIILLFNCQNFKRSWREREEKRVKSGILKIFIPSNLMPFLKFFHHLCSKFWKKKQNWKILVCILWPCELNYYPMINESQKIYRPRLFHKLIFFILL